MPDPPYVAVIFTNRRTEVDDDGYGSMADEMETQASRRPGFLGLESVRSADRHGITVSYWADEDAALAWKDVADHLGAQRLGRERWYERYVTRVAVVGRHYEWERP
jgi:heme-degrading monooxygenase HmoA